MTEIDPPHHHHTDRLRGSVGPETNSFVILAYAETFKSYPMQ
jgi:hypothetical protein